MRATASAQGPAFALTITAATGKSCVPFLRKNLSAAQGLLRSPLRELSLALVGERKMAELHLEFMGIPGPTDVLTFPLEEDGRGRVISGEVVVCVPVAKRMAAAQGVSPQNEVLLYALHGLLHLCGFDDKNAASFEKMHRTEDKILRELGIGAVFSTEPPRPVHRPTRRASRRLQ